MTTVVMQAEVKDTQGNYILRDIFLAMSRSALNSYKEQNPMSHPFLSSLFFSEIFFSLHMNTSHAYLTGL